MIIPRPTAFAERIIDWQRQHGRHHLPWQGDNPYHVWLSEVMLQQTQVSTVLNYFPRFIATLPTVSALADAPSDDVLSLWSGLGYYSRARNLHHAAKQVMQEFDGEFPHTRAELETLKGVGRSTAAAIAVFAFGKREAIMDGNVKRVLIRHRALDAQPTNPQLIRELWSFAEDILPSNAAELRSYTQGLMDLGSLVCTRAKPNCSACPINNDCQALAQSLTHELPRKKTKVAKPHKQTVMLMVRCGEHILLERRPDKGIWRSLWSFPEFKSLDEAQKHAATLGDIQSVQTLTPMKHTFTHYHLTITPILIDIDAAHDMSQFMTFAAALSKGLPKPTRSLLEHLQHDLPS